MNTYERFFCKETLASACVLPGTSYLYYLYMMRACLPGSPSGIGTKLGQARTYDPGISLPIRPEDRRRYAEQTRL